MNSFVNVLLAFIWCPSLSSLLFCNLNYLSHFRGAVQTPPDNSPYRLAFNLIDSPVYFEAPILNEPTQRKFDSSDIDENTGLPKNVKNEGAKTLYTRNYGGYKIKNSGLSRLYLGGDLGVVSSDVDFQYSFSGGRVALVAAEGSVV